MGIHLKQLHAVFQAVNAGENGSASLLGVYLDKDSAKAAAKTADPAVPAHFKPAHYYTVTLDGVQVQDDDETPLAQSAPVEGDSPPPDATVAWPIASVDTEDSNHAKHGHAKHARK